ncbi:MAG: DUF45 domain-containing protein, partial [Clostridia bacterium]|nr:DUF45 domain-containing protein [Clostridia bacterium]
MLKSVITDDGRKIVYDLQVKNVKNINLRIKPDCSVSLSANRGIPQKIIDDFVLSKAKFIFDALEKYSDKSEPEQYFTEVQLK